MTIFSVKNLSISFGGLKALANISFDVEAGEIFSIIGPNGAGKTTLFNLITGFLRPNAGKILFEGKDITGQQPHSIAEKGIIRTFQLTNLFSDFTVQENVVASCHLKPRVGFLEGVLRTPSSRKKAEQVLKLSRKEFGVLRMLAARAGRVVTRNEMLDEVWGHEFYPTTRTVDNHIASLRAKLEDDPANPRYLITVHGVGYKLVIET